MALASILYRLFLKPQPLIQALEDGSWNYHMNHAINGYDRQELTQALDDYMSDYSGAYEALTQAIYLQGDSHA